MSEIIEKLARMCGHWNWNFPINIWKRYWKNCVPRFQILVTSINFAEYWIMKKMIYVEFATILNTFLVLACFAEIKLFA